MIPPELDERARAVLSPREYDVFRLRCRGWGHRKVADALGISLSTERDAVRRYCRKLEVPGAGKR